MPFRSLQLEILEDPYVSCHLQALSTPNESSSRDLECGGGPLCLKSLLALLLAAEPVTRESRLLSFSKSQSKWGHSAQSLPLCRTFWKVIFCQGEAAGC